MANREFDEEDLVTVLNNQYLCIKFTVEKGQYKSVPFLGLRISRNDEELEFDIYGRSSYIDNFIHKTSNML